MGIFSQFGVDRDKADEGVWYEIETFDGLVRFKLRHMHASNPAFQKAMDEKLRPYRSRARRGQEPPSHAVRKASMDVFCEAVLLDWENVRNEDGEQIPFTADNAKMVMEQCPDLYDELAEFAASGANFRRQSQEVDAGNSVPSSSSA